MNTKTISLLIMMVLAVFSGPSVSKNLPACSVATYAAIGDVDKNVARWQKSRALYLHDLQLARLEQRPETLSATTLEIADTLTDADLYVAYAEADRLALKDTEASGASLKEAGVRLGKAYALARDEDRTSIDKVRKTLASTQDMIAACNGMDSNELRDAFEGLRKSIDQLVTRLG